MATVSSVTTMRKMQTPRVFCRKREKEKERGGQNNYPYKVIEITPPPKSLGVRCFPSNLECGESVTIEGQDSYFTPHCRVDLGITHLVVATKHINNLQCGESVTIEGQAYTISAVTHRYQLRRGKYEPRDKRLDVLSTGRYILNLYLENLLQQS